MLPRRALISIADPDNLRELEDLVQRLLALHVEVVASTDNAAFLHEKGIEVRTIDSLIGRAPGVPRRIEALDPRIFLGILASEAELPALPAFGSGPIDLVVVDLPPVTSGPTIDDVLAATVFDRPALIRAAAASYARVILLVDRADYGRVMQKLIDYDEVSIDVRRDLAIGALGRLARYDATLGRVASSYDAQGAPRTTPELFAMVATRATELRAGTNAQQVATFYAEENAPRGSLPTAIMYGEGEASLPTAPQVREAARALSLVAELGSSTTRARAAVFARGRPVSVVVAASISEAVSAALQGVPRHLSSPLLVTNVQIDVATATILMKATLDTLVTPSVHVEALDVLQTKPGLCIMATRDVLPATREGFDIAFVPAGIVMETRDRASGGDTVDAGEVARGRVVTQRAPTDKELRVLEFAWKVAKHAPSDAIVIAHESDDGKEDGKTVVLRTIAIGAGAASRSSAIEQALALAGAAAAGAVLASDASIDRLADLDRILAAGVLAVAHPGSAHDAENVTGCTHVLTMIATGIAHVRC